MSDHDGLLDPQSADIPSGEVSFAIESRRKDTPYPWDIWSAVEEGEIPLSMAHIDSMRTLYNARREFRLVEITKKTLH